jgi:DNA-binding Lrp family transcriptional regulator
MSKAFVFLNCDIGSLDTIIDELLTMNGVSYAHRTQGVYDIIVKLESGSQEELRNIIVKMRRIDAVHSSLTLIVTKE